MDTIVSAQVEIQLCGYWVVKKGLCVCEGGGGANGEWERTDDPGHACDKQTKYIS